MIRKIPVFWYCLLGTILLTAGVIFLPRHLSRSLDQRRMNHMEVSGRSDFSFLKPASNDIVEVARAFQSLDKSEIEPVLLMTLEDPAQISRELLEAVYEQAMYMSEYGVIPWVGIEDGIVKSEDGYMIPSNHLWYEDVTFARSYSLTYASLEDPNQKEMLNFWYLHFSDGRRFDYSFIINAITYQIYYAKIYNESASHMAVMFQEEDGTSIPEIDVDADKVLAKSEGYLDYIAETFAAGCENYYGAGGNTYVGHNTLNNKMGIVILYYHGEEESTQNIYVEKRMISEPFSEYMGISVGFQGLIRWADELL